MTDTEARSIDVATVRRWLGDGGEIALIDVREEGQHGAGHPLLAVNLPYSRLELAIGQLVPRRACRIVLVDDGDGVADKAAHRQDPRHPRREVAGHRRRAEAGRLARRRNTGLAARRARP